MEFRYRSYEEMKDSGIEWIGEIPKEWIVSKFKYFYTFGMGETILKENLSDNGLPVYSATEEDSVFGKYNNAKLILKEGDIIIPARGNSIGAVKIAKDKCTCTQTTIYAKKIGNIDEKFIYYFMKGNRNYLFYFDQTAIPQITTNQVKENILVYGDVVIQNKIAKFLDEKTAQFDSIISKKEALIEKLEEAKKSLISEVVTGKVKVVKSSDGYELVERKKEEMKDSGVEWLGDIPKEWEVKKIKYISVLRSGDNITAERIEEEGIYPVYGGNGLRGYTNKYTHEGNYILIGRQGALCGNINYAYDKFWASEHAVVVNPILKVEILWLGELLRSMNLNQYSVSAAQPGLSVGMIENLRVPFVSLDEQKIISQFINKKNIEIDFVINKTKEQVEKLKEAKQSLISEAVTGKIEIL